MRQKLLTALGIVLIIPLFVTGQERRTGAVFNMETIAKTPRKIQLSFQSYRGMPEQASLESFCPTPGDQGNHGTCVAFANGYGIATLLYARTHQITDKNLINKYAFSPSFLYNLIKDSTDTECQMGSDPVAALLTMMSLGTPFIRTVPYSCQVNVTEATVAEAMKYTIKDASILYGPEEFKKTPEEMISLTKKAILEGMPVSAGFHLPESFFRITGEVWNSDPNEAMSDWKHNGHAMAVVGYDDNKAGGAFRILNSWGSKWADHGYVWMKYADYTRYCILGIQVFANPGTPLPEEMKPAPKPKPDPVPVPVPLAFSLSGNIDFRLNTGEEMPVNRISSRNLMVEDDVPPAKEELVAYTMTGSYASGTRFRFFINIDQEAYLYAFASDLSGKVNRILPYDDMISTHVGSNSIVAFPSDTKIIRLDENKGTDYLLILYSKEPLDSPLLLRQLNESGEKGLSSKIIKVLGDKLIRKENIQYDQQKVGFRTVEKTGTRNLTVEEEAPANSKNSSGTVVPLMVEIKHN